MTEKPGLAAGPADLSGPEAQQILDAAEQVFSEIGVRRATVGDVARKAGVDRVTIYRRIGAKDDLVNAVIAREAALVFEKIEAAARQGRTFEDRMALSFAATIEIVRDHAMLNRMLDLESETLLPQLTIQGRPLIVGAVGVVMHVFDQAVQDGLLASADHLLPIAELLVRVVHSFMLTPAGVLELESHDQLVQFAREHMLPLVPHA